MSASGSSDVPRQNAPLQGGQQAPVANEGQAPPTPTSRISVKRAVEVIQSFDEFKRWLVSEIGFGGMLHLPLLHKLNLKFSAWTMSKVSVRRRAIVLSESKILKFWPEDVHKVFGIPCGHRNVRGRDGFILPEAIQFIKRTLGMDKTDVHSLKAAEEFLLRDISESSSKLEKDYFQIAFVIFVMGHVLAPTTKHDYATIDYWGALADMEAISQFNWCEYVLECLLEAVCRVKNDMLAGNLNTNLVGCHLWLLVFFLDDIDLGMFNKRHDVLPRIGAYDQASIRKMITMATDIGTSVLSFYNCTFSPRPGDDTEALPGAAHGSATSAAPLVSAETAPRALGPINFAQHMQRRYPTLSSDVISILLKEQNVRWQREINTAQFNVQADMIKFVDKLMDELSKRCVCCTARGFTDCPARAVALNMCAQPTVPKTLTGPKIPGVRLDMSECSASNSTVRHYRKETTPCQPEKRQRTDEGLMSAIKEQILTFAKNTIQAISELFIDVPNDGSTTVFGESKNELPGRKYVFRAGFQRDPWTRGVVPYPPSLLSRNLFMISLYRRLFSISLGTSLFMSTQASYGYPGLP